MVKLLLWAVPKAKMLLKCEYYPSLVVYTLGFGLLVKQNQLCECVKPYLSTLGLENKGNFSTIPPWDDMAPTTVYISLTFRQGYVHPILKSTIADHLQ